MNNWRWMLLAVLVTVSAWGLMSYLFSVSDVP